MTSLATEFKKFLMRGNVVDLAVGVVIGAAFSKIVDAVVAGLFMPIIGLLTGGIDFSGYKLTIYGDAAIAIGVVIQAIFNFVIIGFCLFLVVKAMNRMQKKEEAKAGPTPTEVLLAEIRDELKKRPAA
jgi:large conductance mechanosensitive channel